MVSAIRLQKLTAAAPELEAHGEGVNTNGDEKDRVEEEQGDAQQPGHDVGQGVMWSGAGPMGIGIPRAMASERSERLATALTRLASR